jgi:hypothetical protein
VDGSWARRVVKKKEVSGLVWRMDERRGLKWLDWGRGTPTWWMGGV